MELSLRIRFYAELNDFLPPDARKKEFEARFPPGCTAKAIIENLGVPHTEVDLILANGQSVGFDYRLRPGDRLSVYPVFESWDIGAVSRVRPEPLREPRFILDVHLGKLVRLMRLFGFDAIFAGNRAAPAGDPGDEEIAFLGRQERRIVLTRDRGLLKRRSVTHGYLIRSPYPRTQLEEVLARFDLRRLACPFSRCMACNALLQPVQKDQVLPLLPPHVARSYSEFSHCPSCGKVYWRGTHWTALRKVTTEVLGGLAAHPDGGADHGPSDSRM